MLVPQTSPFEQGGTIWASAQLRALQLTHGPEIERARRPRHAAFHKQCVERDENELNSELANSIWLEIAKLKERRLSNFSAFWGGQTAPGLGHGQSSRCAEKQH